MLFPRRQSDGVGGTGSEGCELLSDLPRRVWGLTVFLVAAFLAVPAARRPGNGGRFFGSGSSRLRTNALMILSADLASRSVRWPLKYAASSWSREPIPDRASPVRHG